MEQTSRSGPPYPSNAAIIGGTPTIETDVPICAIFIALYLAFAVTNMAIAQSNQRKGHHFFISRALFGFCMARVATNVLRIAWATRLENIRLAIAAQIFNNAGVLVNYVVNLVLALRLLRAKQPRLGWSRFLQVLHWILYAAIVLALALVIASVVWSFYTVDTTDRMTCRDIQLACITFLLVFTCIPLCYLALSLLMRGSPNAKSFGTGTTKEKYLILGTSTFLCVVIAGFKAGTTWSSPRPMTDPAWYDSRAAYYVFGFTLEIVSIAVLTIGRIDKRFFILSEGLKIEEHDRPLTKQETREKELG